MRTFSVYLILFATKKRLFCKDTTKIKRPLNIKVWIWLMFVKKNFWHTYKDKNKRQKHISVHTHASVSCDRISYVVKWTNLQQDKFNFRWMFNTSQRIWCLISFGWQWYLWQKHEFETIQNLQNYRLAHSSKVLPKISGRQQLPSVDSYPQFKVFSFVFSIVTQNVSYLNRRKKRSLTCLLIELFNDGCTKVYVCNKSTYLELSKSYTNSSEASIASRLLCINVIIGLLFDILEFNSIRNMCLCNREKLIY